MSKKTIGLVAMVDVDVVGIIINTNWLYSASRTGQSEPQN